MFTGIVQGQARILSTFESDGVRTFELRLPALVARGRLDAQGLGPGDR